MNKVYSPGCALVIYKPHLARKVLQFLNNNIGEIPEHLICCRHEPMLEKGSQIINTCAGCDKRYRELYEGITTISLWEVLADSETFQFPNYNGMKMAIHDACPTRSEERVHSAIRKLLDKMNIEVIEPIHTRTKATCCGDSFYDTIPIDKVKELMIKRAEEMPCEDVVVYCVSCIKSMHIGGKKPRYIIDLLFGEETDTSNYETEAWHDELNKFIEVH